MFWSSRILVHFSRLIFPICDLYLTAQAEQRKGRTGRTCDGTVFRMVTRTVYHSFSTSETPQMLLFFLKKAGAYDRKCRVKSNERSNMYGHKLCVLPDEKECRCSHLFSVRVLKSEAGLKFMIDCQQTTPHLKLRS